MGLKNSNHCHISSNTQSHPRLSDPHCHLVLLLSFHDNYWEAKHIHFHHHCPELELQLPVNPHLVVVDINCICNGLYYILYSTLEWGRKAFTEYDTSSNINGRRHCSLINTLPIIIMMLSLASKQSAAAIKIRYFTLLIFEPIVIFNNNNEETVGMSQVLHKKLALDSTCIYYSSYQPHHTLLIACAFGSV